QSPHKRVDVLRDECGVRADRLQRTGDDPFRLRPPDRREFVVARIPLRSILVPVAHDLVDPSTIQGTGRAAQVIHEMTRKRGVRWRQFQLARDAIDVAVEGLHHAENELAHTFTPPPRCPTGSLNATTAFDLTEDLPSNLRGSGLEGGKELEARNASC